MNDADLLEDMFWHTKIVLRFFTVYSLVYIIVYIILVLNNAITSIYKAVATANPIWLPGIVGRIRALARKKEYQETSVTISI